MLTAVAAECGLPADTFRAAFHSPAAREATARDFVQAQEWGIRGFPALIAEHAGRLHLVAQGYTPAETLRERLRQVIAR